MIGGVKMIADDISNWILTLPKWPIGISSSLGTNIFPTSLGSISSTPPP